MPEVTNAGTLQALLSIRQVLRRYDSMMLDGLSGGHQWRVHVGGGGGGITGK